MAKRLTTLAVENARSTAHRYELADGSTGLRLCVHPSGAKSWIVRYRRPPPDGRTAKMTLDRLMALAEARKWAAGVLAELAAGRDPGVTKAAARAAEQKAAIERAADTVDHWAELFLERYVRKHTRRNTQKQCEHVFRNIMLPAWSGRTVHDISRRDFRELVETVAEDRPIMANRAHSYMRKLFGWLIEQDVLAASPCTGVRPPAKEHARDRLLTDDEVRRLWLACDARGGREGAVVKLLLLTGQRLGEVVGMRRSEIVGDTWSLPPERTKNKRRHDVPLSRQALAIINEAPVIVGDDDHVFTAGNSRRLSNISDAKAAIDARMKPDSPWVLHDLRRVVASGLARLGTPLPTIERLLNHVSGSFRGIVGVYQRHDFAAEKRMALQTWADHVECLARGEPASDRVIPLRRR
jgi:integrase